MQAVLGILVLSFLVLLHELGHFIAAKLLKIPVLVFSLGFGKPLLKKKIGETEYRICPILFGGFVQMEGDEPGKKSENGFNGRPVWQRATVAIAGPAVNIVTAFLFLLIMFLTGDKTYVYRDNTVIGTVVESSPAKNLLQPGDTVISINGSSVEDWDDIDGKLRDLSDSHVLIFKRDENIDTATFSVEIPDPDKIDEFDHGLRAPLVPVIAEVDKGTPAEIAGLLEGDRITAINGLEMNTFFDVTSFMHTIKKENNDSIVVEIHRGDSIQDYTLLPMYNEVQPKDGFIKKILISLRLAEPSKPKGYFLIGFRTQMEVSIKKYTFVKAWSKTKSSFKDYFFMIFDVLGKVMRGELSLAHLSGPLSIIMISGTAAQAGLATLLEFMALISVNLGVLNLMPLVITDGGILSLLVVESIMRKPVPEKVQQNLAMAFTIAFITLFVFVSVYDIIRLPMFLTK